MTVDDLDVRIPTQRDDPIGVKVLLTAFLFSQSLSTKFLYLILRGVIEFEHLVVEFLELLFETCRLHV